MFLLNFVKSKFQYRMVLSNNKNNKNKIHKNILDKEMSCKEINRFTLKCIYFHRHFFLVYYYFTCNDCKQFSNNFRFSFTSCVATTKPADFSARLFSNTSDITDSQYFVSFNFVSTNKVAISSMASVSFRSNAFANIRLFSSSSFSRSEYSNRYVKTLVDHDRPSDVQ